MTKHLFLLLLLGACYTTPLKGQSPVTDSNQAIQFEHLTKVDGFPSDWTYAIVQDQQGFLWLGGLNGLVRYDGYGIEVYRHDPENDASLSDNQINVLYEDRSGAIWIGTLGGLDRFDPGHRGSMAEWEPNFTHYRYAAGDETSISSDSVNAIVETQNGELWVGTSRGLSRLNRDSGTFSNYYHDPADSNSLAFDGVNSLYEDKEGMLWIGTGNFETNIQSGGMLHRYNPDIDNFTRIPLAPGSPALETSVLAIEEDRVGTLYVGTCGEGFYRLDRSRMQLDAILNDPENPDKLQAPPAETGSDICSGVIALLEDRSGKLWVGTHQGGINRYNPATHTLTRYRYDPLDPNALSGQKVVSLYEDRQGIIWIGTEGSGLNKVVPSHDRFHLFAEAEIKANNGVRALYEDDQGLLWVGTVSGQVFQLDPATGAWSRFSSLVPQADGLWATEMKTILKDRTGLVWIGENGGLFQINGDSHTRIQADLEDVTRLSHDIQNIIIEDDRGRIWVGTWGGGVNLYDRTTGRFTRFMHNPDEEGGLGDNRVMNLFQDRNGTIWVGTFGGGVNRFNEDTQSFTAYLNGISTYHLNEDPAGRFWIGTTTDGLFQLDRETGESIQYTMDDGLLSNAVIFIADAGQDRLWLVMANGLSLFDPATGAIIHYTEEDGYSNYAWVPNTVVQSENGSLYIGGYNGVTRVNSTDFAPNQDPPGVAITGLEVFDESHSLFDETGASIKLSHTENELTFSYVALHFMKPSRNQYAYRLDGYDTDWQEAGTLRTAKYTNLSPGQYVFQVKASNSDGVWNEEGASLAVTIQPPWWRTVWAYLLYGLVFFAGVFTIDRIQRRRLIRQERERARERELEQARKIERAYHELRETKDRLVQQEKLASLGELTAGIAHEIKNPLNFVNNFAELMGELVDELGDELHSDLDDSGIEKPHQLFEILADLKSNADQIAKHGRRADNIVSAMMQHASGGTGQAEPTDVNALLEEYTNLAYHGRRAQKEAFTCEIERDYDEGVGAVELIPQDMGRVLLNLLGNAFDATSSRKSEEDAGFEPRIRISTRRLQDAIEIRIADNGPGIPDHVREKIFEPFYTTKPTGSGTGLGLSMSYDIVTGGHGGSLSVESEEGRGATFIITLPG